MKYFYFNQFDNRKPYNPIPDNKWRTFAFQALSIITLMLGLSYLNWRWKYSLNFNSIIYSSSIALAESLSFIGTALLIFNNWSNKDPKKETPVHYLSEIENIPKNEDRPIKIDVFIATYNEDPELLRYTISDAKKIIYPYNDVPINIFLLDDGKRDGSDVNKENLKLIANQENIIYISRNSNSGFKAGNLKNGLENSSGDLLLILDADTRAFPNILINTTGYFKNKLLAWVQTPQWFYDITEGITLSNYLCNKLKIKNHFIKNFVEKIGSNIKIGEDIFGNNPQLFYDVLLRRRNFYNAAFCCGAGSIHRRKALYDTALKSFSHDFEQVFPQKTEIKANKSPFKNFLIQKLLKKNKETFFVSKEITPFKYHASEDIYTSLIIHADKKKWESIQHPDVECKMLSPLDINSWVKQRSRYAAGSLDIAFRDNPLLKKGLTFGQKISYFSTLYSYFAPIWLIVFLFSPIIFFFLQIIPVNSTSFEFFKYFLPFQILNTIIITLGNWGINTSRTDQYYVSSFWLILIALFASLKGKHVQFNVTPKNPVFGKNFKHILPHLIIISLTIIGILYNLSLILFGIHSNLSGFITNAFWGIMNIHNLSIFIRAAYWKPDMEL